MSTVDIIYNFEFDNNERLRYEINLDKKSIVFVGNNQQKKPPEWTSLNHQKCTHCPLKKGSTHCPIAVNLADLLESFKHLKSIQNCNVIVETEVRNYQKKTDIQTALGSMFGLIMATSGCPSLSFLKPMARFHLPFASTEETIFRSFGSFLIGEYLKGNITKKVINEKLQKLYATVNEVNLELLKRISHLTSHKEAQDADQNAIVILDTFATMLSLQLEDNISLLQDLYEKE